MPDPYVSITNLKKTLELSGSTFADQDIAVALDAASRGVDKACNTRFYPDTGTGNVRVFDAVSRSLVITDDLITVTTVKIDADGDGTYETTLTSPADYFLGPVNADKDAEPWRLIERNPRSSYSFPLGPRGVQVAGRFGWLEPPSGVVQATTIIATKLMRRGREAPFGVVTVGLDGAAVRIARNDPDVMFLLEPYTRGPVGAR